VEVIFLGTAASEGLPAPYCSCRVCEAARRNGGRDLRLRSSVLIDRVLRVDASPDTVAQAQRLGLAMDGVRVLLVTHTHEDHLHPDDIRLMVPPFSHTHPGGLEVLGPSGVAEILLASAMHAWAREAYTVRPLEPFRPVEVAGYRVVPLQARHVPERTCLNYLITGPDGARLLYATDTGFWGERTFSYLEEEGLGADAVIMEATNGRVEDDRVHLSVAGLLRMRRRLIEQGSIGEGTPFYATHYSHGGGMLQAELEEALGPHGVVPAYDGFRFEVGASV